MTSFHKRVCNAPTNEALCDAPCYGAAHGGAINWMTLAMAKAMATAKRATVAMARTTMVTDSGDDAHAYARERLGVGPMPTEAQALTSD